MSEYFERLIYKRTVKNEHSIENHKISKQLLYLWLKLLLRFRANMLRTIQYQTSKLVFFKIIQNLEFTQLRILFQFSLLNKFMHNIKKLKYSIYTYRCKFYL